MATKDYCLSLNNKKHGSFDVGAIDHLSNQYSNLNLNQNFKTFSNENSSITSKNVKTAFKNVSNYASLKASEFENNSKSKGSLNFSFNDRSKFDQNNSEKKELKSLSNNSKYNNIKINSSSNNSTLSLHITAYENSIEASSKNSSMLKSDGKKVGSKWKYVKQLLSDNSTIQNSFEFPRQQERNSGNTEPEVAQFKASQRLRNVNANESNVSQNETPHSENQTPFNNVVREAEDHFEPANDIVHDAAAAAARIGPCYVTQTLKRDEKFRTMMGIAESIIGEENFDVQNFTLEFNQRCKGRIEGTRFMSSWVQFFNSVERRYVRNNYQFQNADDERCARIQRNFDETFCNSASTNSNRGKPAQSCTKYRKLDAKVSKKCSSNVLPLNAYEENNGRTVPPTEQGRRKKSIQRRKYYHQNSAPSTEEQSSPLESQPGEVARTSLDSLLAVAEARPHMASLNPQIRHQFVVPIVTSQRNANKKLPYPMPSTFQRHSGNTLFGGPQFRSSSLFQSNGPTNREGSQSDVVEDAAQAKSAPPSSSDDAATVSVSSSPVPMPQIYNFIPIVPPQSLQPASPAASNQPQPVPQTPVPPSLPSTPSAPQQQQQLRHVDTKNPPVIQPSSTTSNQHPPQIVASETSQQQQNPSIQSNIPPICLPSPQQQQRSHPSDETSPATSNASEAAHLPQPHFPQHLFDLFKHQIEVNSRIAKNQNEVINNLFKNN